MKSLKDILNGKKESKVVPGSTGDEPMVDYAPSAKKEQEFIAKHKVEKQEDRVGNDTVPYKTTLSKAKFARHGKDTVAAGKATYEETEASGEQIDELSKSTLSSYVNKASKNAVGAADELINKQRDYTPERKKAMNRPLNGKFSLAVNKLNKEEVEKTESEDKPKSGTRNPKFDPRKDDENDKFHEEVEQIAELSDDTLKSYKKKATDDLWDQKDKAEYHANKAEANRRSLSGANAYYDNKDKARDARKKASNRAKGILQASDKLNKEETDLKSLRDILEAKKEGYQNWPGEKKKKFFQSKETSDETRKWREKKQFDRKKAADDFWKDAESADKKLNKEKTVNEISSSSLGSYINKAVDDSKNRKPGIALALKKRNGDPKVKATKDKKED